MRFANRSEAGRLLAKRLSIYKSQSPLVIALARGGIPVAYEVANELGLELDVLVVRKVGAPLQPEFGIGAVTEGGIHWVDERVARSVGAHQSDLEGLIHQKEKEVEEWSGRLRGGRSITDLTGRLILLVDDGLATGVSALVAAKFLRKHGASRVVLSVPVSAAEIPVWVSEHFDEIVALRRQQKFFSVGASYRDFSQVSDDLAFALLAKARAGRDSQSLGSSPLWLIPDSPPKGVVIFAHGSGSSRLSPRNRRVAETLCRAGFAALLFDLLSPEEAQDPSKVFDISLLAGRLRAAIRYVRSQEKFSDLPMGFFGASTGAAAALWAAADQDQEVSTVVSRGGRPDLAVTQLAKVTVPVLLIVGGADVDVVELNKNALAYLREGELVEVPGASHLFEEPGALEEVAELATKWFLLHLTKRNRALKVA